MQYVVDGVFFDDELKAREYENQLNEKKKQEENKLEQYKKALASKLKVFKLTSYKDDVQYLAIIVDNDHHKYASAIAESGFGKHYAIVDRELRTRWTLKEVKTDENGVLSEILDSIALGKPTNVSFTCFQNVKIEKPQTSNERTSFKEDITSLEELYGKLLSNLVF